MEKGYEVLVKVFAIIAAFFATAGIIWLCWNAIIPTIFGLTAITYKQSVILLILCNCLFKTSNTKD